jgi:hypothetical protein
MKTRLSHIKADAFVPSQADSNLITFEFPFFLRAACTGNGKAQQGSRDKSENS